MSIIIALFILTSMIHEHRSIEKNCPQECKCYGRSVLCMRLGLTYIPSVDSSVET
jgi:hypothetical protein